MPTGLVWDERYLLHDPGQAALWEPPGAFVEPGLPHVESPDAKRRCKTLLDMAGISRHLVPLAPYPAPDVALAAVHAPEYVAWLQDLCARGGGLAGEATPVGPISYAVACLAAGGAMAAVDAVLGGRVDNAYALVRPPGHHAEPGLAMGFCLFNNVAVACRHARRAHGVERVLVLDWDVHHGNGHQACFLADPSVLLVSLHQDGVYPPLSGAATEVGEGPGRGFTVNIPLPAGTGDGGYRHAFERVVVPVARQFRPDLVLISAGQDGSAFDPLGRMVLSSAGYRAMARAALDVAAACCRGRLVAVHEGGYSPAYTPFCTAAIIEEMAGLGAVVQDPFLAEIQAYPSQALAPHQEQAVARAAAVQQAFWHLD